MRSAVDEFWQVFLTMHKAWREEADEDEMDELLEALHGVDPRLHFYLGRHNQGVDLIISAEGHCDALDLLEDFKPFEPHVSGWGWVYCYDADLLFGRRNPRLFPDDANGDVLYRMARSGDRLCVPRQVDFAHVFPDQPSADGFRAELEAEDFTCEASPYVGAPGHTWQVDVAQRMRPEHGPLGELEQRLGDIAARFGGRSDGWGCMQQD